MRFEGKTAIVTGAGHGIGKAIALRLAHEGAKIAAVDINKANMEETAETIRKAGGTVLEFVVDITKIDEVKAAVAQTLTDFGKIDILINNAGAGWHTQLPFKDTPDGSWEWVLDLNVKGTFFFTHAVLEHMVSRKYGKIINITSVAASVGIPNLTVYAASKGALVSFTKSLAMELGSSQINVNCVSPGMVALEHESLEPCNGTFLGRKGKPEEFAAVIAFLASDEASFVTGAEYLVDGGRVLGPKGL